MNRVVEMPIWLLVLILAFAAVTFASHFLFPSVRWFLRVRTERVVERLNTRLSRPIEPFKLARRYDTIQRLTYDPEVLQAVSARSKETGIREDVVLEEARDYAREIVPAFSASVYFGLATRLARWISTALYRVRIIHLDDAVLSPPEDSTVVYVINHRSNMDYVLLTYLASNVTTLSFAMGEWARIWPLGPFFRSIGGYFIRRKSRNDLYRKVLARYVHIATREGLTQAVFPEGKLSTDGATQPAKLGILHYLLQAKDERDILFVPVSINYDRVLEDRLLLASARQEDKPGGWRFRMRLGQLLGFIWKLARRRVRNKGYRFGHAAVVFGAPVNLNTILPDASDANEGQTADVARVLMDQIKNNLPILPVPLIAQVLESGGLREEDLIERVVQRAKELEGPHLYFPGNDPVEGTKEALEGLTLRRMISREDGTITVTEPETLAYYARSIAHFNES